MKWLAVFLAVVWRLWIVLAIGVVLILAWKGYLRSGQ